MESWTAEQCEAYLKRKGTQMAVPTLDVIKQKVNLEKPIGVTFAKLKREVRIPPNSPSMKDTGMVGDYLAYNEQTKVYYIITKEIFKEYANL